MSEYVPRKAPGYVERLAVDPNTAAEVRCLVGVFMPNIGIIGTPINASIPSPTSLAFHVVVLVWAEDHIDSHDITV